MNEKYIEKTSDKIWSELLSFEDIKKIIAEIIFNTKKAIEKECIKKSVVTSDVHNPILTLSSVIAAIEEAEIK